MAKLRARWGGFDGQSFQIINQIPRIFQNKCFVARFTLLSFVASHWIQVFPRREDFAELQVSFMW